jgi:capsular polysaccharide biosynthesis protein
VSPSDDTLAADVVSLSTSIRNKVGVHEIRKGVFLEVLETQKSKTHRHFRASLPDSKGIETGFDSGPVYVVYTDDAHVDIQAGLTLIDGKPVRETAVVPKLVTSYQRASMEELAAAQRVEDGRIVLPLASQRMGNYCRWWLDSVAKVFVCRRSTVLRDNLRGSSLDVVIPDLGTKFQQQVVDLFTWQPFVVDPSNRLLQGRTVNTSGLTFGGGQRIAGLARELAAFLDSLIIPPKHLEHDRSGELLYVSRNESSMRRILNENDILPGLRNMGFKIILPGTLSLAEQIEAFRNARIVLSPHGAGLTNILFCRPNTTLIEIFPEGGVHGSAFLRIASQLNFNYYYVVGQKVENRQSKKNPNNSDLILDKPSFLSFVRRVVDAELK